MKSYFSIPKLVVVFALATLIHFAPIDLFTAVKDAFGDIVVRNL